MASIFQRANLLPSRVTGGAMTTLIQETAQIVAPLLAGGAGAVMSGIADEAGAELYRKATELIDRVRHLLGREANPRTIERALDEGLRTGLLRDSDLKTVV